VLPASFPAESGGSFTNAQKVIQEFNAVMKQKTGLTTLEQLSGLLQQFGISSEGTPKDVFMELISLLPGHREHAKLEFQLTAGDDSGRIFDYGCDAVVKRFEEGFESAFAKN
jgi:formate dehydrogenase major subunit